MYFMSSAYSDLLVIAFWNTVEEDSAAKYFTK